MAETNVPSNSIIDLQGATVYDSYVVKNASNITIKNGILLGGKIVVDNVESITLENIAFVNTQQSPCIVTDVAHGQFNNLKAANITGNAFMFGVQNKPVIDSVFGNIAVDTTQSWPENAFNYPGNPFIGVFERCIIGNILSRKASAGVKIYGNSKDVLIESVLFSEGTNENCGVKIQGDDTNNPANILIGKILASESMGAGLYLEKCADVTVGNYMGINNGKLGTYPDVWLGGLRSHLGTVHSIGAGLEAVQIRPDAVDYSIGSTIIA